MIDVPELQIIPCKGAVLDRCKITFIFLIIAYIYAKKHEKSVNLLCKDFIVLKKSLTLPPQTNQSILN